MNQKIYIEFLIHNFMNEINKIKEGSTKNNKKGASIAMLVLIILSVI